MPHNTHLASGYGIGHSDTSKNPRPLVGITLEDIQALVSAPQSVSKEQAQWVIPSTLMTRKHASQRDEGDFHALWIDIDDNSEGVSVERASEAISEALGGCKVMAYTTRSAKPDNLKMRLIVPLAHACCGEDYVALADVLNDVAEECGLKADRATQRPGQLCFLPNRGEVYAGHVVEGEGFDVLAVSDRLIEKQAAIAEEKRKTEALAHAAKIKTKERALAGTLSPIVAFNEAHPLEFVLRGCGYQRCGNRWLSPLSESGTAGVVVLEDGIHWFSNHSSDASIGHESGDGFRGDAFDLFVHFNHVGDRDAAIKEAGSMFTTSDGRTLTQANQDIYREQRKAAPAAAKSEFKASAAAPLEASEKIAERVHYVVCQRLGVTKEDFEAAESLKPNVLVIDAMVRTIWFDPSKSKFKFMNDRNQLVEYSEKDAGSFIRRTFGFAIDAEAVDAWAKANSDSIDADGDKEFDAVVSGCKNADLAEVRLYVKQYSQRTAMEIEVDPYTDRGHVDIQDDAAKVVYPIHIPESRKYNPDHIEDFKQHCPWFDEYLQFLVYARLAGDRKKAFLWIHAVSDFGKTLITQAIFDPMQAYTEASPKEIEGIVEGKPSGQSVTAFAKSLMLHVDEWKHVKSEIKQLENGIRINVKNGPSVRVPLYAKVFTSADSLASLVTQNGVEDQFANRFSILRGDGRLDDRPLFLVDKSAYVESLRGYAAMMVHRMITDAKAKGRDVAGKEATQWLTEFHKRNGLANGVGKASEHFGSMAADFVNWIDQKYSEASGRVRENLIKDGDCYYVQRVAKVFEDYCFECHDSSTRGGIKPMRDQIMDAASADGRGYAAHRQNGRVFKAVKVQIPGTSTLFMAA